MRIARLHCCAFLLSAGEPLKTLSTQIAHMTNCKLSFVCSEEWRNLTVGDVSGVRHCANCKTDVYAMYSESEFDVQKAQGHCVATFIDYSQPTADLNLPSHICDALVGHEVSCTWSRSTTARPSIAYWRESA